MVKLFHRETETGVAEVPAPSCRQADRHVAPTETEKSGAAPVRMVRAASLVSRG